MRRFICGHQGCRQDSRRWDSADLAEAIVRHQGLAERRRLPSRILQGADPGLSQGRRDQGWSQPRPCGRDALRRSGAEGAGL